MEITNKAENNQIQIIIDSLITLSKYEDGWMNGEGTSYSLNDMQWLIKAFTDHYRNDLHKVSVFPTVEGEIQLEWDNDICSVSCYINLESKIGWYHMLNMKTDQDFEINLDLGTKAGWDRLTYNIHHIFTVLETDGNKLINLIFVD